MEAVAVCVKLAQSYSERGLDNHKDLMFLGELERSSGTPPHDHQCWQGRAELILAEVEYGETNTDRNWYPQCWERR